MFNLCLRKKIHLEGTLWKQLMHIIRSVLIYMRREHEKGGGMGTIPQQWWICEQKLTIK